MGVASNPWLNDPKARFQGAGAGPSAVKRYLHSVLVYCIARACRGLPVRPASIVVMRGPMDVEVATTSGRSMSCLFSL